jgi:polar amino acid transport system permease protein
MMNVMLVIYLILTGAVVVIINRVEAAMRLPGFGLGDGQ